MSSTEGIYIKNNGNVGIGTSAPDAKLSIVGDAVITDNVTASYFNATSTTGYQLNGNRILTAISANTATLVGVGAGNTNPGSDSTFVGYQAGYSIDSGGHGNTLIGSGAGYSNNFNTDRVTAVGYQAGYGGDANSESVLMGYQAGYTGRNKFSVIVGFQAGYSVTGYGNGNVLLGYKAGDNITSGDNNIVIGYNVDAQSVTDSNTLNIGNLIFGTGLDGRGTTLSSGNIGIGTTTPQGALDVVSTTGAFIVPRMTTTQRDALTAVNGMIIYNTTKKKFNFYQNNRWRTLGSIWGHHEANGHDEEDDD